MHKIADMPIFFRQTPQGNPCEEVPVLSEDDTKQSRMTQLTFQGMWPHERWNNQEQ